jgi:hypothetical protein
MTEVFPSTALLEYSLRCLHMSKPTSTIHVEFESVRGPDSDRAVLDVFKLLLKDLDGGPVDNEIDGPPEIRY